MSAGRAATILVAGLALVGLSGSGAAAGSGTDGHDRVPATGAAAHHHLVELMASEGQSSNQSHSDAASNVDVVEYRRGAICGVDTGGFAPGPNFGGGACPRNDAIQPPSCDGQQAVEPLWVRRRQDASSKWGPWQLLSGWSCPEDLLPPFTAADLRQLPLAAPALTMQPHRGWVLVNKDTIAYSDRATQTFRTSLLGHPMTVVATPRGYTWDFGDGYRTTTTSPGHPYPDQDVAHPYTRLGTRTITLTVTWTATYQYDGFAAVRTVDGTATTTGATEPFTVEERLSHLVAQTCDQNPHAYGC